LKKNKVFLIIFIILGFYVGFIFLSDINKITEQFINIKAELVPIIFSLTFISLIIRAFRQWKLLDSIGIKISFKKNILLYFAGMSMIITPVGAGELIKSHFLKEKYGEPISKTAPIVFVERFQDLFAVITILFFTITIHYVLHVSLIFVIGTILLAFLYFLMRNNKFLEKIRSRLSNVRILKKIMPSEEFNVTLIKLTNPKVLGVSWGISLISFLFDSLAVYFGLLAFGVDLGFLETAQIYYTSILAGAITFLPAGIGVTEASFAGLLVLEGLEIATASSIVLFTRLATIWFATILGFVATRFILK